MRKLIIAAVVLVGAGLVLFLQAREETPLDPMAAEPAAAGEQAPAATARAGTRLQPEHPGDVGVRGTADAGSTPTLAQAPSEEDGVLEVEVLAGTQPVPGASVRLYWRGARDPNLDEVSWRLASQGATDEQGRARLASRPGGYLVAVRAQGYAPLTRDVVRPYGEARTHLRLTVEPGHALTGRTVVQGTQEPLPLVELVLTAHGRKLEPWQFPEAPAEERAYASSDTRGTFRVEGLAPGSYLLEARAPGHAGAVLRSVQVPAKEPLTVALQLAGVIEGFVVDAQGGPAVGAEVQVSGRTPQVVTTGQGGGFSVEVEAGAHSLSARRGTEAGSLDRPLVVGAGKTVREVRLKLGQGAGVEGRVYAQATGAAVAGASVDVSPYGSNGDSGRAVTDDTGHFSVGGLAPGSYDVVVSAPGFSTLTRRGLTVSAGERFPLELALTGTGAVAGVVRNGAGQPVQGALVVGGSRWGGSLGNTPAESRTDAEGHYRLEGLSAGRLYLTARREGAVLGAGQLVQVTEGGTAQADFTLEETGTVEGVVRAARGALPSEPLFVTAMPQERARRGPPETARAEVDPGGRFRMVLPPGTYGLLVATLERLGGTSLETRKVQVEAGKTVQAELTWDSEPLPTEAGIQGTVLEPDGTPSLRAYVTAEPVEGSGFWGMTTATDEQGRFSIFIPPMRNGNAPTLSSLKLTARNGGRSGEAAGVKPGEQNVVLRLKPGTSVRGRVVRSGGSGPVKGFTIELEAPSRQSFWMGGTSWEFAGDRFELRDAPAASVKLVARTSDGAVGEALVTLGAESTSEVEITVKSTASVSGRVLDGATNAPVPDAFLRLEGQRSPGGPQTTRSDGRFTLERIPPGEHVLIIMAGPSRPPERRPVTLVEGQVADLGDIVLSPPGTAPPRGPPGPPRGPGAPAP
jgi:hypothetical protein